MGKLIVNGSLPGIQTNEKSLQWWLDHALDIMVHVHEVRFEYEKQSQMRAASAEDLAFLKQEEAFSRGTNTPREKNGISRMPTMLRNTRIASLEDVVNISSNTLVTMASQLSEAEERERAFTNRGRWNRLRNMGDAKSLLQYTFTIAADIRCQLREKEIKANELKDKVNELVGMLRQSEARRKEIERQHKLREQYVATAMPTATTENSIGSLKHYTDETSAPLSLVALLAQKQLNYTPGIANSPS